uniref:Reelin domain-containing protein n=1 Tax=Romanomermis culicivorax TaxID=13658 RepID=A0A915IXR3_ROMCU
MYSNLNQAIRAATIMTENCHDSIILVGLFFVVTAAVVVDAFPNGAPCEVKDTLLPNTASHGENKNANAKAPYEVVVLGSNGSPATCIAKNTKYTVKLKPVGQKSFRGFILQSVDKKNQPVGKFADGDSSYKYLCFGETTAITHKSGGKKTEASAEWTIAQTFDSVHIKATVVEEVSNYYTGIESKPLSAC